MNKVVIFDLTVKQLIQCWRFDANVMLPEPSVSNGDLHAAISYFP